MNIIVLLKQVPATESNIEVAEDNVSIKTEGLNFIMNPYDEIAVEEALKIKEAHSGNITVISCGGERAKDAIKTAYAMGVDNGILINDENISFFNGLQISKIISTALKSIPFDIIIAGQRAVDDDNYFVGTAVSDLLNIPSISFVIKEDIKDGRIICTRSIDGGTAVFETSLPALITCQRGLNEPRYTSLKGVMMAKKKPIETKTLSDIGIDMAFLEKGKTKILKMIASSERAGGEIIDGNSNEEKVQKLIDKLKEKKIV